MATTRNLPLSRSHRPSARLRVGCAVAAIGTLLCLSPAGAVTEKASSRKRTATKKRPSTKPVTTRTAPPTKPATTKAGDPLGRTYCADPGITPRVPVTTVACAAPEADAKVLMTKANVLAAYERYWTNYAAISADPRLAPSLAPRVATGEQLQTFLTQSAEDVTKRKGWTGTRADIKLLQTNIVQLSRDSASIDDCVLLGGSIVNVDTGIVDQTTVGISTDLFTSTFLNVSGVIVMNRLTYDPKTEQGKSKCAG
jgi:hypothetical protein